MARLYERDGSSAPSGCGTSVEFSGPGGSKSRVEVEPSLMAALDDLQRELWRADRREARHTLSLDALPPNLTVSDASANPEEIVLKQCDRDRLAEALSALSSVQRRRLAMRSVAQLGVSEIAGIEGCSERAVRYSLARATKNMKEILAGGFPS